MKKVSNTKKVYMYDTNGKLLRVFDTSFDCADYFEQDVDYLYHNIKYCKRIRHKKEQKWYVIKRH